jgi:transcriptional regulator of acetoin/glycerol metabolism
MALTIEKVRAALTLANGNVSAAARMLGVSRPTIYKWMKRLPNTNKAA